MLIKFFQIMENQFSHGKTNINSMKYILGVKKTNIIHSPIGSYILQIFNAYTIIYADGKFWKNINYNIITLQFWEHVKGAAIYE